MRTYTHSFARLSALFNLFQQSIVHPLGVIFFQLTSEICAFYNLFKILALGNFPVCVLCMLAYSFIIFITITRNSPGQKAYEAIQKPSTFLLEESVSVDGAFLLIVSSSANLACLFLFVCVLVSSAVLSMC